MARQFSDEYQWARGHLRNGTFSDTAKTLVGGLKLLLDADGFNATHGSKLDTLRQWMEKNGEVAGHKSLAGTTDNASERIAAIKFLRHIHMVHKRGEHAVWVGAMPKAYRRWPSAILVGQTDVEFDRRLAFKTEYFSDAEMQALSVASQKALAWTMKAVATCATDDDGPAKNGPKLIRRWFCGAAASDTEVEKVRAKLKDGYAKIANAANGNKLILTDYPEGRSSSTNASINPRDRDSGLPVVKVYAGFFSGKDVPLTGSDNAARIIVHELSHLVMRTDDERYRHARDRKNRRLGLMPGGDDAFGPEQALNNADSWAFFAADCAGALTNKHIEWLKV
jgi:hypothetical protein